MVWPFDGRMALSRRDKNHAPIEAPCIILALMGLQTWAKIQPQVSTLIMIHISARGLGGCELGNHSHYFQGVARRELRHRLEAYANAMLHCAVAWWLWVPGTRLRKHFDRSPI
jgi:hypothetical protein